MFGFLESPCPIPIDIGQFSERSDALEQARRNAVLLGAYSIAPAAKESRKGIGCCVLVHHLAHATRLKLTKPAGGNMPLFIPDPSLTPLSGILTLPK